MSLIEQIGKICSVEEYKPLTAKTLREAIDSIKRKDITTTMDWLDEGLSEMYHKETPKVNINTMKVIKEKLRDLGKYKVLRQEQIPLFIGNPGLGKTRLIYEFAEEEGRRLVPYLASSKSPLELRGMNVPDWEKRRMTTFDFDILLDMKDGDILFLDEVTQAMLPTLSALLVLLDTRVLESGKPLADIIIVAAGNEQGMSQFLPQTKRRFQWINVSFDEEMWTNYMINKYCITPKMGKQMSALIKKEEFKGYNFNTSADLDKAVMSMCHNSYTPYQDRLKPILSEFVENKTDKDILLPNSEIWSKGESIEWLKLKQYEYGVIS
jgi:hypothetical protein